MVRLHITLLFILSLRAFPALGWGFFAHKQINKHAVFTLPTPLFTFYKRHLHFITENAVNPNNRRYVVEGEAPRHYIDMEYYDDSTTPVSTLSWQQAAALYPEEMRTEHGILPWHIDRVKHQLTEAFRQRDGKRILRLSADLGHYIADAHVPLHTSENYDGQLTDQEGIHGLWETRLPELFTDSYDFLVGQATYLYHPQADTWEAILTAHQAVESVLRLERELTASFPATRKYSFEQRSSRLQKVHAFAYAEAYHHMLEGQVERQMRASIKMVGSFWLTCWIDAGRPDLEALLEIAVPEEPLRKRLSKQKIQKIRSCKAHGAHAED